MRRQHIPVHYRVAFSSPGPPRAVGGLGQSADMSVMCAGLGGEPALLIGTTTADDHDRDRPGGGPGLLTAATTKTVLQPACVLWRRSGRATPPGAYARYYPARKIPKRFGIFQPTGRPASIGRFRVYVGNSWLTNTMSFPRFVRARVRGGVSVPFTTGFKCRCTCGECAQLTL